MKKIFVILAVMALCASCGTRTPKSTDVVEVSDSTEVVVSDSTAVVVDTALVAE